MPIIFGGKKHADLGAIKGQLPFSEGKCQLLNSWNTIPFLTIFYHLNFQLPHPNRSNKISLLKAIVRYEKAENCNLSRYSIISRWVPLNVEYHKQFMPDETQHCREGRGGNQYFCLCCSSETVLCNAPWSKNLKLKTKQSTKHQNTEQGKPKINNPIHNLNF